MKRMRRRPARQPADAEAPSPSRSIRAGVASAAARVESPSRRSGETILATMSERSHENRPRRLRAARAGLLAVAMAAPLGACGGATPAVAPPPPAPSAPATALASAAPAPSAAPAADPAAAQLCLATAEVKRAKFSGEPAKITVKHVLVRFAGAKNAPADVKRTKEQACLRAMEARDKVRDGADWADVVKEYSEEPGAATRDGLVGVNERKDMAKPFADAAFELGVNQMSDVVETEFGFHVLLRKE
jgi:hypothetical protein